MFRLTWVRQLLAPLKPLLQWCSTLLFKPQLINTVPENILVYSGPGVGPLSLKNMLAMLRSLVSPKYTVKQIDQNILINESWLNDTALLVIPGGADLPYTQYLNGKGNENIRKYVHNGGKFLGVCAGAYYAADRIEFAMGDREMQVAGERELKFFPGLVEGPTYPGFHYDPLLGIAGQRAATVYWQDGPPFAPDNPLVLYYNGGGHFVDAHQHSNVTILARYACESSFIGPEPAAIIECKIGKGAVILSGLHFEWDPDSLEGPDQRIVKIKSELLEADQDRLTLSRHLLRRLGIGDA